MTNDPAAGSATERDTQAKHENGGGSFQDWLFAASSALAAVLRIVYLLPLRGQPLFDTPQRDSIVYVERARAILAGDFWGSGVSFHSAPLYPYFLALVMGPGGDAGLWWVRIAQALVSALTAGLLALTALRLFGRGAAVATAILAIFYAPFLFYAGELLEITLTLFFLSVTAWLVADEELSGRRLLVAGVFLGLAALGKPNLLILAPVIAIHVGLLRPPWRPQVWPWRRVLLLALGLLVVILPFTLRNKLVGDDWVLVSSNGGINLFIGNNPSATGGFWVPTAMQYDLEASSLRVAEEALGRELKPSEASRFWFGRAKVFFLKQPGNAARNFLRKTGLLLGHYEIPNHFNIYFFRDYLAPLLKWPLVWYTIALPLAVVGLVFASRRSRATRRAALCALGVGVSVVLFFVTGRYRLPILIWLLPFAGAGLLMLWGMARRRRWRILVLPVLIVITSSTLMHLPLLPAQNYHEDWLVIGNHWAGREDWEKVAFYNQQALRENMESAAAWQNLGYAYFQLARSEDDFDRAEECLWRAASLDPAMAHAFGNLAALYFKLDRPLLTQPCLERALALDPALKTTLQELVKYMRPKMEDFEQRSVDYMARIEKNLAAEPDRLDYKIDMAYILALRLERYDESEKILDAIDPTAVAADPELSKRVERLRIRIERARRYTPLLERPLGPSVSEVTPFSR